MFYLACADCWAWMPRAEGLRCFDVFNVSGVDSNSHGTLSDRQPPLPGVTSHGTRGDCAHTGPFLSHRVALVTPPLQCHCITLARLVTHLPCDGRVSKIESFCKSFCCAKTAHGISICVNTQWRIMYFITYISKGNTGLYLPSPSTTAAPTQPNYFSCKATQEERVTQKHSWNWDRPHHCLAAPTT